MPWSIILLAVPKMETCETDLWKGARKPVVAVSPLPAHAGPKPPVQFHQSGLRQAGCVTSCHVRFESGAGSQYR